MVSQHGSKATNDLLKDIKKKGFKVSEKNKKGVIKITPPEGVDGPVYSTHGTESAFHYIKRDFAKLYNIKL